MKFGTPLEARAAVQALAASKIRELYNEGLGRKNILAFWVGEPDEATPEFKKGVPKDRQNAGGVKVGILANLPEAARCCEEVQES